jgi:fibronectin-binding autotransporter adhesin
MRISGVLFWAAVVFLASAESFAQTFVTFDSSGSSAADPADGSGVWSTRTADWSTGSSDVDWTNGFVADIGNGGTAGTITVNDGADNVSALGIYLTEPYTLGAAPGNTLSLTGTHSTPEPVISVATGLAVTITAPIGGGEGIIVNPTTSSTLDGVTLPAGGGTGTLVYANNNTYQGGTTVEAGTLQIGNGGSAGTLGAVNLTDDATVAFDRGDTGQVFTGHIGGTGVVEQIGSGATTLSNNNNDYSGGTTISAGTLVVANTSGSATGNGPVTLNAGTLAGAGSVSGLVSTSADSHIAPGALGAGNFGTLIAGGGLIVGSQTFLDFDLNTTTGALNDLIDTTDLSLALAATDTVEFNFPDGTPAVGVPYSLIDYSDVLTAGSAAGLTATGLPPGYSAAFSTTTSLNAGAGSLNVTFSAVPEPSVLGALAMALLLWLCRPSQMARQRQRILAERRPPNFNGGR